MDENTECHPNTSWHIPHESALEYLYSTHEAIIIIGVIPILLLIGFIGNFGFLLVLFRLDDMRSITNFYLGNLAIADLSFMTAMTVRYIWSFVNSQVEFNVPYQSSLGCVLMYFVVYISIFSSFAFVTLVTVERYFAICWPLKHRIVSGKTRSIKLVLITWIMCALFAGLFTPSMAKLVSLCVTWPDDELFDSFSTKINVCTPMQPWMSGFYRAYVQGIPFWISLIINTVMCIEIIRKLSQRKTLENPEQQDSQTKMDTVRNQVATMLIINNLAYFMLLAPFHILNVITIIEEHLGYYLISEFQVNVIVLVARVTTILNSAINPIIYSTTNRRYREAFARCFGCRQGPEKGQREGTTRTYQISGKEISKAI